MSRAQRIAFALVAALLLVVPTAWGLDQAGFREPLRLLQALTGTSATFSGTLGVTGQSTLAGVTGTTIKAAVVDAGTIVGDVFASTGTITSGGVISAGAANVKTTGRYCTDAACTTNYLQNDTFGSLNVAGPASFTNNVAAVGTIQASDYVIASGGIRNTGTAAPCASNTGAVCVNDVGGLAVGDGAGATVATVTATGAAVLNGGVTIGSGGQAITASTTGSATLDFASALVSTCSADLTIAVTATASSTVDLSVPSGSVAAGSMFFAWVSGSNVVSVRHCCEAGTSCDPASGVFVVRVFVP